MSSDRWKHRPDGSTWGDFGIDDQLGRLNLLTPERVVRATQEVRTGQNFCLSLPLDCPPEVVVSPFRHAPILRPGLLSGAPNFNRHYSETEPGATDVINDDLVVLHLQGSTQWDSFAHVGQLFDADGDGVPEVVYYNGYRGGEHIAASSDPQDSGILSQSLAATTRVTALGIDGMATNCVQGRGVLVDLAAHYGQTSVRVGYDALMHILDEDGVTVEEGDMLLFHTGFAQRLLDAGEAADLWGLLTSTPALDGRDQNLLDWITRTGVATISADNFAVEEIPSTPAPYPCAAMPLHEHCLFKLGIHLGELWYLSPLAAWLRENERSRFLLTAPPLRLPGAVGSPVSAVATV